MYERRITGRNRLADSTVGVQDVLSSGFPQTLTPSVEGDFVHLAQQQLAARRRLTKHFPEEIFGDVGWIAILSLYVAQHKGQRLCVVDISDACGITKSSAKRLARSLEHESYLARRIDERDGRRADLQLTPKGLRVARAYLQDCAPDVGLPGILFAQNGRT